MFLGYTVYHEGYFYNMLCPSSRTIHQSRDITWLKRMYCRKKLMKTTRIYCLCRNNMTTTTRSKINYAKINIIDTYGNESDSGYEIIPEDENYDHAVIDGENINRTTAKI